MEKLSERVSRAVFALLPEHQPAFKTMMAELRAMEARCERLQIKVWWRDTGGPALWQLVDVAKHYETGEDFAVITHWEGHTCLVPWQDFMKRFDIYELPKT